MLPGGRCKRPFVKPTFLGPGGLTLEGFRPSIALTCSSTAGDHSWMGSYPVLWSWHRIPPFFLRVQAFWFQLVHFGKLPIGMDWFLPLDDTGKNTCQDSTESMPVGRIRAFRSKQCPFWVNFGYVVPEIKYAPKLLKLIRYNGYGMVMTYVSWNQAERWRRKSSISTANTPPQPDFARPEQ